MACLRRTNIRSHLLMRLCVMQKTQLHNLSIFHPRQSPNFGYIGGVMSVDNKILLVELLKTTKYYYFVVLPFLIRRAVIWRGKQTDRDLGAYRGLFNTAGKNTGDGD